MLCCEFSNLVVALFGERRDEGEQGERLIDLGEREGGEMRDEER